MKALLLSGGIDSSALAAWKRPDIALTVDYGQRSAAGEIDAAKAIAAELRIAHEVLRVDLSSLGAGPLAGKKPSKLARAPEWWPYRNQLLITLAGMLFVSRGLKQIIIGAVATDIHADGKSKFIKSIDRLMQLQEGHVRVIAPAVAMTSERLLVRSKFPRSLLGLTFSCHALKYPCGRCPGCKKHAAVVEKFLHHRANR
jgi:7-cyano-7-deazaguanine synthase